MNDIMFENMKALEVPNLEKYAAQIGLDVEKFKADLSSNKYAAEVKAEMAEGQRAGVRGTPSVFINGRQYKPSGGYNVASMEKLLAQEFGLKIK